MQRHKKMPFMHYIVMIFNSLAHSFGRSERGSQPFQTAIIVSYEIEKINFPPTGVNREKNKIGVHGIHKVFLVDSQP